MKIAVYEARGDEMEFLRQESKRLNVELAILSAVPSVQTAALAAGCEGASFLGHGRIDAPLLDAWKALGVKYLSARIIGYDHIDVAYAHKIGLRVCNSNYAPDGVADFTVMLMLMCLRQYKQALWRGQVNDFSLVGLQGREIRNLTVGIVGTGRIGAQVARDLSGFGCRILACAHHPSAALANIVEYIDFDTLLTQSDIITLHVPLTEKNRHMINRETIARMKDGVIIINCARGELADMEALIAGIESQKIGALGMDTAEGDEGIIHTDHRLDILPNRNWFYLHQFRNVIMTQHMAFYTDAAVQSMVRCGIEGICAMAEGKEWETELK